MFCAFERMFRVISGLHQTLLLKSFCSLIDSYFFLFSMKIFKFKISYFQLSIYRIKKNNNNKKQSSNIPSILVWKEYSAVKILFLSLTM